LAGLRPVDELVVFPWPGPVPGPDPDRLPGTAGRRGGRPPRSPQSLADVAVYPDEQRVRALAAGIYRRGPGVAYSVPLRGGGHWAVLRRTVLFRTGSLAGAQGAPAERDLAELHPVQPGARDWPDHRWNRSGHTGSRMVFCVQWHLLYRGDHHVVHDSLLLRSAQVEGADHDQHETGPPVHSPPNRHGSGDRTCFLHDDA